MTQSMQIQSDHELAKKLANEDPQIVQGEDGFDEIFTSPSDGQLSVHTVQEPAPPQAATINQSQRPQRKIEDEFDIIDDEPADQALYAYYNDGPTSPDNAVPITDKFKQGITNLGFMLTTNGSKKVDLNAQNTD